jgi:hypothetical protein
MRRAGNRPAERAQDHVAGPGTRRARCRAGGPSRARRVPGVPIRQMPSLQDALTAALRQRVAQRAARTTGTRPSLVGYLCERCLDAPALLVQPAPWGGEMGVCAACQQEPPADDAEPDVR